MTTTNEQCYLLHFETPYKHAKHYLGTATNLDARLAHHEKGTGSRLCQVVKQAGIRWVVARTWQGGRDLEAKLKRWHSGVKLCPLCQQERILKKCGL